MLANEKVLGELEEQGLPGQCVGLPMSCPNIILSLKVSASLALLAKKLAEIFLSMQQAESGN